MVARLVLVRPPSALRDRRRRRLLGFHRLLHNLFADQKQSDAAEAVARIKTVSTDEARGIRRLVVL
jgi:hypothetical protein